MDIVDIGQALGRVETKQDQTYELLKQHIDKQNQMDSRLQKTEQFISRANTISGFMLTLGAGLWSVITLKFIR